MESIVRHLKSSSKVLVASHISPDGDAVGTLVAMGLALEKLGKKTVLFNESPIPAVYRFLPASDRIVGRLENCRDFDTALILDCGDILRLGCIAERLECIPTVINIDHHGTNTGFGDFQFVDAGACATAELVYYTIRKMDVAIDEEIATAIYTGILTDTGSFRFSNTNPAAFEICREMAACGVQPHLVAQHVYGTYSLGRLKLLNMALDSIEISDNGKLSVMTVTQEMLRQTGTQPEDADGLIHYARRIEDVRVAALIQELKNGHETSNRRRRFHVSLRSDGSVDVGAIAASFGGGGHVSAAGFGIDKPLAEVKTAVAGLARIL